MVGDNKRDVFEMLFAIGLAFLGAGSEIGIKRGSRGRNRENKSHRPGAIHEMGKNLILFQY